MIGFDSISSKLLLHFQNRKLPHAILLHGKKGIGKASFAKEFCLKILAEQLSHPDLLIIEKDPQRKEINIEKIRQISQFINHTSAASPYKFIIIDSACELNKSSSNALLKILEEPHQNNFIILISHNLNLVLPTIRSRCQIIRINHHSGSVFKTILQQNNVSFANEELEFISEICDNSPAEAINFGGDLLRFYQLFLRSILNQKIGEELFKKISDKNFPFEIIEKSCVFFLNRLCKTAATNELKFFFEESEVFAKLKGRFSAKNIFTIIDRSMILLNKTVPLNLDKKLSFVNVFNMICYE